MKSILIIILTLSLSACSIGTGGNTKVTSSRVDSFIVGQSTVDDVRRKLGRSITSLTGNDLDVTYWNHYTGDTMIEIPDNAMFMWVYYKVRASMLPGATTQYAGFIFDADGVLIRVGRSGV